MAGVTPDQLRGLFAEEAKGRLAELEQLLHQLEQTGGDQTILRSIFREFHTLNGSAAVAGLAGISRIAHDFEELVETLRVAGQPITSEIVETLRIGADQLRAAIRTAQGADRTAPPVEVATRTHPAPLAEGWADAIQIPLKRWAELSRLVADTAATHQRLGGALQQRFKVEPATFAEFEEQSRLLSGLQDWAMRTQQAPVSTITQPFSQAVSDLACAQGKQAHWQADGTETEMDRGVLSQLFDPLMQLVCNAVDHGIEPPEERLRAGKRAEGIIRLHAMQVDSDVVISVTDDGRGIDVPSISRQADRRGIETTGMTADELLGLTFELGLSTTRFVTDGSGRGVGLDRVRTSVEAAHGRVEVQSHPGAGTEFRIIVPIDTAVLRCLVVEAGGRRFALPLHQVQPCEHREPADGAHSIARPVIRVRGQSVPSQGLAEALGLSAVSERRGPLVVLADGSCMHAFQVDRLIGQRDVRINTLIPLLPDLPTAAGTSVEPDGSVLVVLDPPGLIRLARRASGPRTSWANSVPEHRKILVVDDAPMIRELQRAILVRAGFEVRVATDGRDALARLAEAPSDLVLTDLQMPNMGGCALTEAIKADPTLTHIPVLILSSSSTDEDRQRGFDAGASGYFDKGGFDETSMLSAVSQLLGARA